MTVLSAIFVIALILRIFFAYGTSAGSGYALSGGSNAAYHLHVIENILNTGKHIVTDPALNYPFGGLNYSPALFDWSVAVFAYPLTLFGYSAADAASIALVYSTAIIGALTCIPVYFLGKEMFSKRAGFIASAFFAISSIAITRTVFSNGTESAFFVMFFVLMTLFLIRAVKAFRRPEGEVPMSARLSAPFRNRTVLKNMILAILSLTALTLSWMGFFAVILILCAIMAVQALSDRLRGQNASSYVMIYGITMLPALLIASIYFFAAGMDTIILGPICLAALFLIVSLMISYGRIWVATIPVTIVMAIAVFALAWALYPDLYGAMTSGFSPYAGGKFGILLSSSNKITLSTQSVYAGMATMWFSFIVAGYMVLRLPKNADSPKHMFIVTWLVAMLYASWKSADLALLAAPMYAIGTGVVIARLLHSSGVRTYIGNFKGSNVRSVWRKILKPIPLLTVLGVVFIMLMPNVLYAVDASIPSNDKSEYESGMHVLGSGSSVSHLGATNYYIKDNDWNLSEAWDAYAGAPKDGALVTWLDYGAEAVGSGNFQVVADGFGNGYAAASNILLGDPSEATAAMAVRMITYAGGIPAGVRALMTTVQADRLDKILFGGKVWTGSSYADTVKYVRSNPDIYGATSFDLSKENAMYLAAVRFMTEEFTDGKIGSIYNAACAAAGSEISYIGVTGNMLPIYYGDSNTFGTIAFLNDYYLDSYASPTKYYSAGVPYYGYYYTYTDAMYETMIWKSLIGMSLEDYRASTNNPSLSMNELMRGLMISDGEFKAYPGFGMGDFAIDEWWVLYNSGTLDELADWELITAADAQSRQNDPDVGGLINYFGGMVFLKYDNGCKTVSGKVSTPAPAEPVGGVTVALFDIDGNVIAKTITKDSGEFSFMVPQDVYDSISSYEIGVYSGSVYAMEITEQTASATQTITIPMSQLEGTITGISVDEIDMIEIELTGARSGKTYSFKPVAAAFGQDVVPDTYSVTMTLNNNSVYTGTFTLYPGSINVGTINAKSVTVEVTVKDRYGTVIPDAAVELVDVSDGSVAADAVTGANGVATGMLVAPGDYIVRLVNNEYDSNGDGTPDARPWMLVTSSSTSSTTAFSAKLGTTSRPSVILMEAVEVEVSGVSAGDVITFTNGAYVHRNAYTTTVVFGTDPIYVPVGDYGNASSYTASVTSAGVTSYYPVVYDASADKNTLTVLPAAETCVFEILLKYKDAEKGLISYEGTVVFVSPDLDVYTVAVPLPDDKEMNYSFKVELPALADDGRYTVYAYARYSEKKAYLGTTGAETGNEVVLNMILEDAIAVSGEIRYTAATTTKLAYVPVIIWTTVGGEKHTIVTSTDSLGAYYVMLPKGNTYYANTEMYFGTDNIFVRAASDLNISSSTDTSDRTSRNISVQVNTASFESNVMYDNTFTNEGVDVLSGTLVKDVSANRTEEQIGTTGIYAKVTDAAPGSAIITLRNSTGDAQSVKLVSADLTFDDGTNPAETGEITVNVPASDSLDVNVSYTSGDPKAVTNTAISVLGDNGTITLTNNSGSTRYVILRSGTLTFKQGDSVGKEIFFSLGTSTVTSSTNYKTKTVDVTWELGDPEDYEILVLSNLRDVTFVNGPDPEWMWPPAVTDTIDITSDNSGEFSGTDVSYEVIDNNTITTSKISLTNNGTSQISNVRLSADSNVTFRIGTTTYEGEVSTTIPVAGRDIYVSYDNTLVASTDVTIYIGSGSTPPSYGPFDISSDVAKTQIGTTEGYYEVNNACVSSDIVLTNEGTSSRTVKLGMASGASTDISFRLGDADPVSDEIYVTVPARTSSGPGTITVAACYDGSSAPSPTDVEITVMYKFTVSQSGTDVVPDYENMTYPLRPGSYDVLIEPTRDAGEYYSGRVTVYADTYKIDLTDLLTDVTVLTLDTEKDDKVTIITKDGTSSKAIETKASRDRDDEKKEYYIPTDELDNYIIKIEGTRADGTDDTDVIAYIDLEKAALPIVIDEYLGEKRSVSGYVGLVADGTAEITIHAASGYETSITVSISKGVFKADLPLFLKDDGDPMDYTFTPTVTSYADGKQYEFTANISLTSSDDQIKNGSEDKNTVNMEVSKVREIPDNSIDVSDITDKLNVSSEVSIEVVAAAPGSATVELANSGSKTQWIRLVSPEITFDDGVTSSAGEILISVPAAGVTVYVSYAGDDTMVDVFVIGGVMIDPDTVTYNADGTASGTFDVINDSGATIILTGGSGWRSFTILTADSVPVNNSYALIPPNASPGATVSVSFTATYDPENTGEGSTLLSVIAKDATGTTLLTETMVSGTVTPSSDPENDLGFEPELNRVSSNEYGYGLTITNNTHERLSTVLSITDSADYLAANWYASIVDSDNVIIDPSGEVTIDANSSATFYLRLIWTGAGEIEDLSLDGLALKIDVENVTGSIELVSEPTDIGTDTLSASGDNVFGSLNGVPNIIWGLAALLILLVLLIVWLGIRRGVFTRKR